MDLKQTFARSRIPDGELMRIRARLQQVKGGPVAILAALGMLMTLPAIARGQEQLTAQCAGLSNDGAMRFCNAIVEAVEIGQPRLGLSLIGGNPVPGASSTLGMRLGAIPRLSLAGRVTAVTLDLPAIDRVNSDDDIKAAVPSINLDASLGVLTGLSLFPTVGGFGSIDVIASVGMIPVPEGEGFGGDNPFSWALGARLGILRESFTAPGISVTGTYRRMSDVTYGDRTLADEQSYFEASDMSMLSVRGVIGKRILMLGANAGVGYDRFKSNVAFGGVVSGSPRFDFAEDDFTNNRTMAFGSLSFTMLILSIIAEAGWQNGGDEFTATLPTGQSSKTQKSAYFGSLAIRLSI